MVSLVLLVVVSGGLMMMKMMLVSVDAVLAPMMVLRTVVQVMVVLV